MRVFAVSDLHADLAPNRAWLDDVSTTEHTADTLIVAGDVADRLPRLAEALALLRRRFAEVFFVPGNHELWARGGERDSVAKFDAVLRTCAEVGVRTAPGGAGSAWIVPLFSWYDASFDVRGEAVVEELDAWSDRYFCRWPAGIGPVDRYFLDMNEGNLVPRGTPVISFSHFVPRTELVPPVSALRFKGLPQVAGSLGIEEQIRRLGSSVHVFGHTHIPVDRVIDSVRYVQHYFRPPTADVPLLKEVWPATDVTPSHLVW